MADEPIQAVPPLPTKEKLVKEQSLYLTEISLYRNTLAFGGARNPTEIWAQMTYRMPQTMGYFRELEDKDEDVADALDTLKRSVTKRARSVLPANDKNSAAVDTKDFIEDQLKNIDVDGLLDCILDAPGYGFTVQEMIFDVSAGQAALTAIDDCPQELFLFANRFRPQIGPLQLLDNPWASEGTLVDESKFIVMTYRKHAQNRMGRPMMKSLFWPSWFKRNIQRLWLQFAEKGPGTAVVYYDDPNDETQRKRASEIAQAIVNNVAFAVPQNFRLETELLKVARSQDPSVYERLFEAMQHSITRYVLGETQTNFAGEGGKGTQALGTVHSEMLNNRSVALAIRLMGIINEQLVKPLVLWNYGPDAPIPSWTIETKEEEDLARRVQIDSALQRMGKKFTVGYVAEQYQVPLVSGVDGENAEDVLQPNTAAPAIPTGMNPDASFSEGNPQSQAHREMKEFDGIFKSLYDTSNDILKQRIDEIANAAVPVVSA